MLDLCTGNGSLAVLAAWPPGDGGPGRHRPMRWRWPRINADRHGLQDRIRLVESDGLPTAGKYDLILCNPPYVCRQHGRCRPNTAPQTADLAGPAGCGADRRRTTWTSSACRFAATTPLEDLNGGWRAGAGIGNERTFRAAFPLLEAAGCPTSAVAPVCYATLRRAAGRRRHEGDSA